MSQQVVTGQTDWSIRLWAYDSAGAAVTGLAYNSAGMAVSVVVRSKGRIVSTTALTLVARSGAGVHTDSAWTEVSGGEYVVDLPDSYLATAERTVSLSVAATAITGTVIVETIEVGRAAVLDPAVQTQIDSIETDVAALAAAGEITITSPVVDMGADGLPVKIEIVQGADYLLADSTQIAMSLTGTFPAWTSASAYLDIMCGGVELSLTGTITTATGGTRALYFELTATQSATLVDSTRDTPSQDIGVFDLRVVLSNTHVTYPINRGKFVSRRRSQA